MPRPKSISSAECDYKGALRLTYRDSVLDQDCTQIINRTWQASDGCGNVVYLTQVIKITRPRLLVRFPLHVPNGCVGAISLAVTGRPVVESPCKQERVRVAYRDNISKKDCQEKGKLLERHFTVAEVCGREYSGVQRIYPGESSIGRLHGERGRLHGERGDYTGSGGTAWGEGDCMGRGGTAWREGEIA